MAAQVVTLAISPAQRWQLLDVSHAQGQTVAHEARMRYRRFMEAFGLAGISRVVRRLGKVAHATASDEETLELVEVTAESVEYALDTVLKGARAPIAEDILGPLIDQLEAWRAGRELEAPGGLPRFDAKADTARWLPVLEISPGNGARPPGGATA